MSNNTDPTYTVTHEQLKDLYAQTFESVSTRSLPYFMSKEERAKVKEAARKDGRYEFGLAAGDILKRSGIVADPEPPERAQVDQTEMIVATIKSVSERVTRVATEVGLLTAALNVTLERVEKLEAR